MPGEESSFSQVVGSPAFPHGKKLNAIVVSDASRVLMRVRDAVKNQNQEETIMNSDHFLRPDQMKNL